MNQILSLAIIVMITMMVILLTLLAGLDPDASNFVLKCLEDYSSEQIIDEGGHSNEDLGRSIRGDAILHSR